MASTSILLTLLFLLLSTLSAPAPIDLTDILVQGDQFTFFLRLLNQTRILEQLQDQLDNSNSNQGMTLFAPTDTAFHNLRAGTINGLSEAKKMTLVLYHILPKFYTMGDLVDASNPVPTQAAGDHGVLGLNFTGKASHVHVSTGAVEAKINKALTKDYPFAVYVVDQLLIPLEFSDQVPLPDGSSSSSPPAKAKAPSSPAAGKHGAKAPSSQAGKHEAMAPNSQAEKLGPMAPSSLTGKPQAMPPSLSGGKPEAMAPSLPAVSPSKNGGGRIGIGMGFGGFVLFCMAFL